MSFRKDVRKASHFGLDNTEWIMGSTFQRSYYTIYDLSLETKRLGIVGGRLPPGTYVKDDGYSWYWLWWIMGLTVFGFFIVMLAVCLCIRS